jgi:general secretion pathway protein N
MAVAGCLAAPAEGAGSSRFDEIARASIEIENSGPSLTRELPAEAGSPADAGSPAAEPPAAGNPLWSIPISKLSATRDRPLFSSSRRPPTPTVAAAPAPPPTAVVKPAAPETPPFTLVGTIIGENSRIAILFDENSKIATGVREGDSASGWTLRSVDPRSATVEGSGRTVTLDLPEPTAQDSAAQESQAQESPAQESPAPPRASGRPRRGKFQRNNSDGL